MTAALRCLAGERPRPHRSAPVDPHRGGWGHGRSGAGAARGRRRLRLVGSTWFPLFFGLGLVSSYLGAFHHPDPHGFNVVVAGRFGVAAPVATEMRSHGDAFDVSTPDAAAAVLRAEVETRRVSIVCLPEPGAVGVRTPQDGPETMVALAFDPSVIARVGPTFLMLGAAHGQPVTVADLVAYSRDDYKLDGARSTC